ncbi:TetR/AcrR family transcriptional regulator [Chryseobacterium binzhouense]|uniref:TetR/AcrR family transcriptional regulator n=1 Tax=Chryseobacterium binzhouense TaxID=2593646 RepID=UPI00117E3149|nr:TetR/AcrR family transcriptional regulator [Chryseobacterium binzhouense]
MRRARTEISKENRKQFILDCAEELILAEGLSSLSLIKVSKKTKLAVGTIYLYFSSKEDIIANLTIKSREILLEKFIQYTSEKENAIEKIAELLKAFYSFYKEKPFYNQLVSFYETNSGLEETEELKAASFNITKLVSDIIREGKKENIIQKDLNEMEFSFWLWATTIGVIQLLEIKGNIVTDTLKQSESEFYKNHIKMIISSLG